MAAEKIELVELKPIAPFCGSYVCALADCDTLDDGIEEKPDGSIVKVRVPRKRFVGLISVERMARPHEIQARFEGGLPERFELIGNWSKPTERMTLVEHPEARTVRVPKDIADDLVKRGLAVAASPGGIVGALASLLPGSNDRKKQIKGN